MISFKYSFATSLLHECRYSCACAFRPAACRLNACTHLPLRKHLTSSLLLRRLMCVASNQLGEYSDRYGSFIGQLHAHCEGAIYSSSAYLYHEIARPAAEAAQRFPIVESVSSPIIATVQAAYFTYLQLYNSLHDWLVPVAMEIADKLPLLSLLGDLVHRYCEAPPRRQAED